MAQFDSVEFGASKKILDLIFRAMTIQGNGGPDCKKMVCAGSGTPTDDTEEFDPIQKGTLYYDYSNDEVFVCTAYTDKDTFTMVQIT